MTEFYTRAEVVAMTGLHHSQMIRMERDGRFPKRVKSRAGRIRWKKEKIDDWITERDGTVPDHNTRDTLIGYGCRPCVSGGVMGFRSPRGFVFRVAGVLDHFVAADKVGHERVELTQCPDYPLCKECRK